MRDEALERGKRLDGRAFDEIRPITIEVGVLPRTHGSALFTRGETQALVTATLGTADDQQKIEMVDGEIVEALHAALQLPAVLGRRSAVPARPRPARDRPRRARRALADADDAGRRQVPLHRPRRLRHPRVERLLVDGLGLRRHAGDDGRRRADQAPVAGIAMGLVKERAPASTPCSPTSPATKTTTATWTSRSPAPPPGITALQMDIKVVGHHDRDHAQGAGAGARRAGCTSSTRCWRRCRGAQRHLDATRRAS